MTSLRLYDTQAREKRVFTPADPNRITMYLCGPTVYGRAHIGNARPAVVFDVLARLLRHLYPDHRLDYARNITDVDDKIIAAAEREGVEPSVITARYERHYLEDTAALGVAAPPIQPRATEHIAEMIAMIARLIELGHAYAAEGHVLFSTASDPDYGSLSRRDADAIRAGARVEVAPYKRDPADFVLWKPSDPNVIGWDSPWGRGRPGWHIECSAMIERHLGRAIDIHAGGLDLIFPHHENEAAQSRCVHDGAPLANIWMHNGFLSMGGGEKMSKSLGNVALINDLLSAGQRGEVLRLALLSAHYRQPLEWTESLLRQAKATLDGLYRTILVSSAHDDRRGSVAAVVDAVADDLQTPLALSRLAELGRTADTQTIKEAGAVLGILQVDPVDWMRGSTPELSRVMAMASGPYPPQIDASIALRSDAKTRRDFAEADRIRAELADAGILLEDTPAGTTWRRA